MEATFIAFLLFYTLNYFVGRKTNERIAMVWGKAFRGLFEENFTRVGDGALLIKESQCQFRLAATGRLNCIGLQALLDLRKRHDLIAVTWNFFNPSQDILIIDVALEHMDPFIFAVVHKSKEKKFRKDHKDVEKYASTHSIPNLPDGMIVLTDTKELIPVFLHEEVIKTLDMYKDVIEVIWFTDQNPFFQYNNTLRFIFKIPKRVETVESRMKTPIKMVLHFIDKVATTKLSKEAKDKSAKTRSVVARANAKQSHEEMQERAQKRKLEKQQKEKEDLENLTPEEQRKRERRVQKKEMKKKNPFKYKIYKR